MINDATIITVVTMVIGFLTLWIKLKYGTDSKLKAVGDKVDDNTAMTHAAGTSAAAARVEAVNAAAIVARKLNGGIDAAIVAAVEPLRQELKEHSLADERNIAEVRILVAKMREEVEAKLAEHNQYTRQRNHDILDALNANNLKLSVVLAELQKKG